MIHAVDVTKIYHTSSGPRTILDKVGLSVMPGEKVGILGRNGAGKSTLIRLLSGAEQPSSGHIARKMRVSWPLAFAGGFQGSLTGIDNLKFICRVYGVDYRDKIDYVDDFSELGRYLREPLKTYSAGMRARLAFALSMAIEFDCFLIDEVTAVGDARFHEKCRVELFEKRADRAKIMVSHNDSFILKHCQRAYTLLEGKMYGFPDVLSAIDFYKKQAV
ncbi:MAG: ABC transporter ATP-binding protein [Micavibrio sp.]